MRKIIETLRLHFECGRSNREISRAIGASPTTVCDYLRRAKAAGLGYPLPDYLDELAIELRLFPPVVPSDVVRPEPDWVWAHREMRKKSVTLELLWQEYKATHPEGYQYSWFCERYRQWAGKLPVTLRQTHTPGEKLFVDYAGQTLPIICGLTGEIRHAQLFVAVLGASNYTFAEATWTQQLPDWVGSHVRAFEFIGGVPEILVPDNLKSGVKHPSCYDPELNPTYRDLAAHYGVTVLPARARKPRDKAKVECGVLVVERWILARLRNQRFFSLEEANRAISALLADLNRRPFRKLPGCRQGAFAELDRPALKALPADRYQFAEWKIARVGIDYHVEIAGHYYSAPYRFARQEVDVRFTATTVEIFHRGSRISWFESDDLARKSTPDGKDAYIDALLADLGDNLSAALGNVREAFDDRLLYQDETDALDIPFSSETPLLRGKTGKERQIEVKLSDPECAALWGLACHTKQLEFASVKDAVLLPCGWVKVLDDGVIKQLQAVAEKLNNVGLSLIESRDQIYFRLSVEPHIIFLDEFQFRFSYGATDTAKNKECWFRLCMEQKHTPFGCVAGIDKKLAISRSAFHIIESIENDGDPDAITSDVQKTIRDQIDAHTKPLGLRKFVRIEGKKYAILLSASL